MTPASVDDQGKAIHAEVLVAAQRLSRSSDWTFRLVDVVRALPHRNERTVRTHVASRCCVNAPANHPHRWPYFRRLQRGIYRIEPAFQAQAPPSGTAGRFAAADRVAEPSVAYGHAAGPERSSIHAVIVRSGSWFVAECVEAAVVTQGRTLDETLDNLGEALELHLDEDELGRLGLSSRPRLLVTYETMVFQR